jgi:hypothetical protein
LRCKPADGNPSFWSSGEHVAVDVEHDDGLGRVLDERAIARFALAQGLLVLQPLGDVAHAQHEAPFRAVARAADGDFDG